ncbi:hypothetical protein L218DRAFT_1009280 [Marasmius fiardii PR-910]|nr:hypothetical protein L218DRAFT_1009280 [Marasmius fiardii PR-910]
MVHPIPIRCCSHRTSKNAISSVQQTSTAQSELSVATYNSGLLPFKFNPGLADLLFPLITTPYPFTRFTETRRRKDRTDQKESFVVESAPVFLAHASSYVGPLPRLSVDNISLFYGIVPHVEKNKKLLCTTIVPSSTFSPLSIFIGGSRGPSEIYFSSCNEISGTRAVQVTLEAAFNVDLGSTHAAHAAVDSRTLGLIINHSYGLYKRLFNDTITILHLTWTVTIPSEPQALTTGAHSETDRVGPLTGFDMESIQLNRIYDFKGYHSSHRGTVVIPLLASEAAEPKDMLRYAVIFESVILEVYLCYREREFARSCGLSPYMFHLKSTRKMKDRMPVEKQLALGYSTGSGQPCTETWDLLTPALSALRRQAIDGETLRRWEQHIDRFLSPEEDPEIRELLKLQPFKDMEDFRNALDKISAKDHRKMVAFIRLSLRHLAELESLDRRHLSTCIGFCPPDDVDSLPNLPAPPRNVAIHNIINASKSFAEQIKSRLHTLQFSDLPIQDVVHLLHVLNSHSDLHPTLTTLNFCRIRESGDSESEELIGSIKSTLKRHSIICLHFDRRRSLLQESELQDAVKNSRKAWIRCA